jgi:hypothetical protein
MHLFNATETISDNTETIAFLEELLAQQKQLSALQKELETLLQDAAKFDPLDHESTRLQEKIEEVSNQVMDLTQYKVDGDALKGRDLVPVLIWLGMQTLTR